LNSNLHFYEYYDYHHIGYLTYTYRGSKLNSFAFPWIGLVLAYVSNLPSLGGDASISWLLFTKNV